MRVRSLLLTLAVLSLSLSAHGQAAQPAADDARLNKLPPALREWGKTLLAEAGDFPRARIAADLAFNHGAEATEFLLDVLSSDPSRHVRRAIIDSLGRRPDPRVRQALERHAASDADAGVAMAALERLRIQVNNDLRQLLVKRMEAARAGGNEEEMGALAREHERWISLVRGAMLPSFLRVPPPIFSLKAADQPLRVLAFGDFGTGSKEQKQVAASMLEYHRKKPFDFGITLGDNFYQVGMTSPSDERWKTWWEDLYGQLSIKIFATLGNHDWLSGDSPAAEILYTGRSQSWNLPSPYYTFTAGHIQFFALDTNEMSEAQLLWLKGELGKSTARWKVAYGHHPIYSAGAHKDNPALIAKLLPILKDRVDAYIAGHDHDLQHLKPEGGLHFFVSGGGGVQLRPITPGPRSLFAKSAHGFSVVEADAKQLKVAFIGVDSATLYEHTIEK
jgi:tartrate-resistant acid phosphatase type 5